MLNVVLFLPCIALTMRLTGDLPLATLIYLIAGAAYARAGSAADSDLATASWIWLPSSTASSTAAFIQSFDFNSTNPPTNATIEIASSSNFTVWINGHPIGASADESTDAQMFSANLNGSRNTISVLCVGDGSSTSAGLLAAVRVTFLSGLLDLTTDVDAAPDIVLPTDATWLVSNEVPLDWPLPSNLSTFVNATVAGKLGDAPWGSGSNITVTPPGALAATDLAGSDWLWSVQNANNSAPTGSVGFRKTVDVPSGKTPMSAEILASADDFFVLYVDGRFISSPPPIAVSSTNVNTQTYPVAGWEFASRVAIQFQAWNSTSITFDFLASNYASNQGTTAAGFIAVIVITFSDGTSATVRSDDTWLQATVSSGSQTTTADQFIAMPDSSLSSVVSLGAYGMQPWTFINVADTLDASRVPNLEGLSSGNTPVPSPSSTSEKSSSRTTANIAIIAAAAGGGASLFTMLFAALMFRYIRRRRRAATDAALPRSAAPEPHQWAVEPFVMDSPTSSSPLTMYPSWPKTPTSPDYEVTRDNIPRAVSALGSLPPAYASELSPNSWPLGADTKSRSLT
ncbi:hypothetical protein HMN09_00854500 [Mycena chlorophos]|uniref:Transmembrane protein n=1 Tax=Mycena chlorophos TaxID=658473 RepID=A0A8H6SSB5_MYCCL|nr:hypothetical protein HMN09_00854500 [Mycena chlorophos]